MLAILLFVLSLIVIIYLVIQLNQILIKHNSILENIHTIEYRVLNNFNSNENLVLQQEKSNNRQKEIFNDFLIKWNFQYQTIEQQKEKFNELLNNFSLLEAKLQKQSEETIEFNDIIKLFMDHAQQRAVRVLEFNEILNEFLELLDQTAQSGSILWIHDPFFRQFRSNLEEVIKAIQFHQQESLQSIQFLTDNNNDNNQEK